MSRRPPEVPDSWWREACEESSIPQACVRPDHKFEWVNRAFERLLGYSLSELRAKTWMDLTVSNDVRGQLQAVKDLIAGKGEGFTIAKVYRHKQGEEVSSITTWTKFPRDVTQDLICFIVEAVPRICTQDDIEKCRRDVFSAMDEFRDEMRKQMSAREKAHKYRDERSDNEGRSNSSGNTKINIGNNSTTTIYWMAVVFAIVVLGMGYIGYLITWPMHNGGAKPPEVPIPVVTSQF